MLGFVKELINAFNLNNCYSDNINTSFFVENGKICALFESSVDIKKYIEAVRNEIVFRHFGDDVDMASEIFNMEFFPFSADEGDCVYSKDGKIKKLVVDIDSEVISNLKLNFSIELRRSVEVKINNNLLTKGVTEEQAFKYIRGIAKLEKVDEPPYLYSIAFSNELFQRIYIKEFGSMLQGHGFDSSKYSNFFIHKHKGDKLYIKDIPDINIVSDMVKSVANQVALDFSTPGNEEPKVKNGKDVLKDKIFNLTAANGEEGIVLGGYDYDASTHKNERGGDDGFAIPKVKVGDTGEWDMTKEEADRINEAFESKGFGNILTDIRGQTQSEKYTESKVPVYGISNEKLALLISGIIMKYPIVHTSIPCNKTNKTITYFEYAMNLGSFYTREHSNLGDDLGRMLLPKFYKDGYLDEKGLSEASKYIYSCLLKSGFGLDGYEIPELAEFVNQKIKEWRIIEENNDKNIVIPQRKIENAPPSFLGAGCAMGGSKNSLSSGCSSNSSRSVSPMPRNSSDSSLSSGPPSMPFFVDDLATADASASVAHKRSKVLSTLDEVSVENSIDATSVQKTSAKSSHTDKVQRKLKKEKSEKCSIL